MPQAVPGEIGNPGSLERFLEPPARIPGTTAYTTSRAPGLTISISSFDKIMIAKYLDRTSQPEET